MKYTREEWLAAADAYVEDERKALGKLPSAEEWTEMWRRFHANEMGEDEEALMRRWIVAYPHMAMAMLVPFEGEEEG